MSSPLATFSVNGRPRRARAVCGARAGEQVVGLVGVVGGADLNDPAAVVGAGGGGLGGDGRGRACGRVGFGRRRARRDASAAMRLLTQPNCGGDRVSTLDPAERRSGVATRRRARGVGRRRSALGRGRRLRRRGRRLPRPRPRRLRRSARGGGTRGRRGHGGGATARAGELDRRARAGAAAVGDHGAVWPRLRLRDVVGDQPFHHGVAAAGGAAAHHGGDQRAAVAMDRGQQVEAGGAGVAGLDAVDAVDAAEQVVVVADDLAVVVEFVGRKVRKYRGKRSSVARARMVRSRAVVICSSLGRPEALR